MSFVLACAHLYADIAGMKVNPDDRTPSIVASLLEGVAVSAFRPTAKV